MHNQADIDKKIYELAAISGEIAEILRKKNLPPRIAIMTLAYTLRELPIDLKDRAAYQRALAAMMLITPDEFSRMFTQQIVEEYFNPGNKN